MTRAFAYLLRVERQAGLSHKDGHPLYAYQVSPELLGEIQAHLHERFDLRHSLKMSDCALFCLFASEHFCNTHEEGVWRWQDVFDAVGFDRSMPELYGIIERGLRFWQRPLLTAGSHREFLVTMACEGGLPRKLLQNEEKRIARYLRRLLQDRECFRTTGITRLAERNAEFLPRSLRNDTVLELCGGLIEQIATLRSEMGAVDDPIVALDGCKPGWRRLLPLRLDDEAAERLLRGLLRGPRPHEQRDEHLRIETSLHRDPWRIARRVGLPPEISGARLATILGVDEGALAERMQLQVHGADGSQKAIATATGFEGSYQLVPLRHRGVEIDGLARLTLVARAGLVDIGQSDLQDGGELSGEVPWIFTDDESGAAQKLLGTGSIRTRRSSVRVLVPDAVTFEESTDASSDATMDHLGGIEQPAGQLVRVSGRARFRYQDDLYQVVTSAPAESTPRYRLRGRHLQLGLGGSEVWCGVPQILCDDEDSVPQQVPRDRIQCRHAGAGTSWRAVDRRILGNVELRVVEDGATCFRTRLVVMPEGFSCQLLSGAQRREGVVRLRASAIRDIHVEAVEGLTSEISRPDRDILEVRLQCGATPPPLIRLRVLFADQGEGLLSLPYPTSVPGFVDRTGQPLGDDAEIPLGQLIGAHAVVHAPRPGSKFRLRGRLNRGGPGWVDLADVQADDGPTVRFSLDRIHDLIDTMLASCDALDAKVELRLIEMGPSHPPIRIQVSRYDASLDKQVMEDGSAIILRLDEAGSDCLGQARIAQLCVEARPIEAPSAEVEELPTAVPGSWHLDMRARAPGGWLVTGRIGAAMRLRPILITAPGERPESDGVERGLLAAVRMTTTRERAEPLREVIDALAGDFGHPDWKLLMGYLEAALTLPASTFDPLKALARNPDAAVRALFLAGETQRDAVWNGLIELPFLWETTPARSWCRAAMAYRRHLVSLFSNIESGLDPARLAANHILSVLDFAAQRALHIGWLRLVIWPRIDGASVGLAAPAYPRVDRSKARESLLRRPGWWPAWNTEPAMDDLLDQLEVPDAMRDRNAAQHCHDVLNAPLLAAAIAVAEMDVEEPWVFALRRLRAFDEDWFEHARAEAFMHLLQARIDKDPEYWSMHDDDDSTVPPTRS